VPTPTPPAPPARPLGWSPGALVFVAAWVVGAAIARLTGAAAVILVLAGAAVALVLELAAGWLAIRRARVLDIETAPTCTAGTSTTGRLTTAHLPAGARAALATVEDATPIAVASTADPAVTLRFPAPGVVSEIDVCIEAAGPAGLIWWRRRHRLGIDPVYVAPAAAGSPLPVTVAAAPIDGSSTATRGNHGGEIDGVRAWRDGDAAAGVHWPSSLRTGELIVHDRRASAEQAWTIDLDQLRGPDDGARLRRTLDEGLHGGHRVGVVTTLGGAKLADDGPGEAPRSEPTAAPAAGAPTAHETRVTTPEDAAMWAARVAQAAPSGRVTGRRRPLLRRELRRRDLEGDAAVRPLSRWMTALATVIALGMLLGALGASTAVTAASVVGVAGGAWLSLRLAGIDGTRPLALRVAMGLSAVAALAWIAVDARGVDGLLAALGGLGAGRRSTLGPRELGLPAHPEDPGHGERAAPDHHARAPRFVEHGQDICG